MAASDDGRALSDWVTAVCDELGLSPDLDGVGLVDTVLDLTADVAHTVSRPGAPVTAFLVGVAAGRAADPAVATAEYAKQIAALAAGWEPKA